MSPLTIRFLVFSVLISFSFSSFSCGVKKSEKHASEVNLHAQSELVSALAIKHGAVIDWNETLPDDFDKVYTADYQKAFLREDRKPLVFFGNVEDVMHTDSGWTLIANIGAANKDIDQTLFFLMGSPLFCQMQIKDDLASQILNESRDYFSSESARLFVVEIKAIKRPRFTIDTESYVQDEGLIETDILIVPSEILYLYGTCIESQLIK